MMMMMMTINDIHSLKLFLYSKVTLSLNDYSKYFTHSHGAIHAQSVCTQIYPPQFIPDILLCS